MFSLSSPFIISSSQKNHKAVFIEHNETIIETKAILFQFCLLYKQKIKKEHIKLSRRSGMNQSKEQVHAFTTLARLFYPR